MRFTTKASSISCGDVIYEADETGAIDVAGEHLPLFAHQIAAGILVHAPEAPKAAGGMVAPGHTFIIGDTTPELFIPAEPSPWPAKPADDKPAEDPAVEPENGTADIPEGDAPAETDDESAADEPESETPADPGTDAKAAPARKTTRKKAK